METPVEYNAGKKEERINILFHDANKLGSGKEIDISKQEAIERIARAKHQYEKEINPDMCDWDDYKERAKDEYYRKPAEYMLKALLGE